MKDTAPDSKHAAAYYRRSSVSTDSPGDASRDAQAAAAKGLSDLYAPDVPLVEYVDWGISGRRDDRPEYLRLKADIAAGKVCCVFAFSLSRLGRSNGELDAFFKLCAANDVTVHTKSEGALGKTSAMGGFLLTIMSAMAELESELAKERSSAARAAKQARGDVFGQPAYGFRHEKVDGVIVSVRDESVDVSPLIEAYREAGSILGACALLEARGVPAPKGGSRWSTSALTRILERHDPALLPRKSVRGRRPKRTASSPLQGLVRCPHCDTAMTPNTARGQLYCHNGPKERASHPRYVASASKVEAFVRSEVDRLGLPDAVAADKPLERLAALDARLERLAELRLDGDISRERFTQERAKLERERADLEAAGSITELPEVDWDWPPSAINAVLRSIFRAIRLDAEMRPVAAEWIIEEWRR